MAEELKDTGSKKDKKKLLNKKEKDSVKGPPDVVDFDATMIEVYSRTAVFGWGRMNPPTIGHEKLVKKIESLAKKRKGVPLVFLSQSSDARKNPLEYSEKISFTQEAFGSIIQRTPHVKTLIQLMQLLQKQYTDVVMVAGSDRIRDFKMLLDKYNGRDYNFNSIDVVSAGDRDPDADGASGMSASKMRAAAAANDQASFDKGVPSGLRSRSAALFDAVRSGLKIIEQLEEEGLLVEAGLSMVQRIRRRMIFRKNKMKIRIGQRKARRRRGTQRVHVKRARRSAIAAIKRKFAGGKSVGKMSPAEKRRVEVIVSKRKNIINRLAKRMVRTSRATERTRFRSKRESTIDQLFGTFLEELNEYSDHIDINDINLVCAVFDEAYDIIEEEGAADQLNEDFETFLTEANNPALRFTGSKIPKKLVQKLGRSLVGYDHTDKGFVVQFKNKMGPGDIRDLAKKLGVKEYQINNEGDDKTFHITED